MEKHRWAIDVIWFLTVHLCPIGPRVLDTCSLNIHTIHMWDHESPQPELESYLISWGHKQFGALLPSCTYTMLYCFIYDCAWSACTVQVSGVFSRCRQAQPHFRVPSRSQPLTQTLRPSRSQLDSLWVYSKGWPPEIFLNLVIALS